MCPIVGPSCLGSRGVEASGVTPSRTTDGAHFKHAFAGAGVALFFRNQHGSNRRAEAFAEKTKEKTGAGALFSLVGDTVALWLDETGRFCGCGVERLWITNTTLFPTRCRSRAVASCLEKRPTVFPIEKSIGFGSTRMHWRTSSSIPRATDLWVQASLNQKQRLQQLFLPEGIAFDGIRFNRTAATAPFFKYLAAGEGAEEKMVSRVGIEPVLS